jgi:RNA polymerase sigma-70 factor (ECF subfamily)
VYGVARRVVGSAALADEVVQETFVKAWRAAASFESGRDPAPWLATIAKRTAIDVVRREKSSRRRPLGDDDAATMGAVDPDLERSDDVWAVRHAVDQLPPDERDVVLLQHLEGLSHEEVAATLGVPVGTVKSRSFRAHKRLASALGHLRGDLDDASIR